MRNGRRPSLRKRPPKPDPAERREDALRPSRFLGYDRDILGLHLMSCEAFGIAESQFRRAVLVNPFEVRFKAHLAWCLHRQGRLAEAGACIAEALAQSPDDPECHALSETIRRALAQDQQSE